MRRRDNEQTYEHIDMISPLLPIGPAVAAQSSDELKKQSELRETFDDFVGQTFFGQMMASMRKSVGKPAYFHGGRAEEVFQSQLDQHMAERIADSSADQFTGPMFQLFQLRRQ